MYVIQRQLGRQKKYMIFAPQNDLFIYFVSARPQISQIGQNLVKFGQNLVRIWAEFGQKLGPNLFRIWSEFGWNLVRINLFDRNLFFSDLFQICSKFVQKFPKFCSEFVQNCSEVGGFWSEIGNIFQSLERIWENVGQNLEKFKSLFRICSELHILRRSVPIVFVEVDLESLAEQPFQGTHLDVGLDCLPNSTYCPENRG